MPGRRRQRPTLQELASARIGQIAGAKVVAFIVQWAVTEEALGHAPTLDEFADWWHASRSTVFREQARFREAFPAETTPQRVIDLLKDEEGPAWFKRGVSASTRIALRGDAMIDALRGGTSEGEGQPA